MMSQNSYRFLFFLLTLLATQSLGAETSAEKLYAESVLAGTTNGEGLWLTTGGKRFFSLYTEETLGAPQGGVILIHDAGGHPNWAGVIGPLRRRLPGFGWSTLSIQLPKISLPLTAENISKIRSDTDARIGAAIQEFSKRNIRNIALIGHGMGARLGASFLAKGSGGGIRGFIGISMATTPGRIPDPAQLLTSLEDMKMPILDLYGSHDSLGVLQTAKRRTLAARRGANKASKLRKQDAFRFSSVAESSVTRSSGPIAYRQIKVDGADHFFTGLELILIKRVRGWLKRHAAGVQVPISR